MKKYLRLIVTFSKSDVQQKELSFFETAANACCRVSLLLESFLLHFKLSQESQRQCLPAISIFFSTALAFFFSSYQTSCLVTSSNVQVYSSSVEQRILERQLKEETKQPKCPIHLLFVFLRFLSGRLFVNLRFGKELDLFFLKPLSTT